MAKKKQKKNISYMGYLEKFYYIRSLLPGTLNISNNKKAECNYDIDVDNHINFGVECPDHGVYYTYIYA